MELFNLIALIVCLATLFDLLNYHFLALPRTIGLLLVSLLFSIALITLGYFDFGFVHSLRKIIEVIDFDELLMSCMLSFLLFAGALHIDLAKLRSQALVVGLSSTVGVLLSTILVGGISYYCLKIFGYEIDIIHCLLFGALISPTDPIAVIGILKTTSAPDSLRTKIAGESLFNDGVGVVAFSVLLSLSSSEEAISATSVVELFLLEAGGGMIFGLLSGALFYLLLKKVDDYQLEILLTLALVMGVYTLASSLHISGPLAVVAAGLLIGNTGRRFGMSEKTREHLDIFWELVDGILNAVLFALIGLEIVYIGITPGIIGLGALSYVIVLLSRFCSLGPLFLVLKQSRDFVPHVTKIMTWAGLRGGISIALALSLPASTENNLILGMSYIVVLLSILIQGLSAKRIMTLSNPQNP